MKITMKVMTLAILLCLLTVPVFGQTQTGTLSGTVRDTTGASIAGATVNARNTQTGVTRSTTTAADGAYTIPGLPPGLYEVTVNATGFAPFTSRVEVTVGATATLDAQLSVNNQTTTIEVVAAGGVEVNTQNQELSQVVNSEQIATLPSLTRNPYDFVALSGNVSAGDRTAIGGDQNTTNRGVGFALDGQRTSGTEILLDGVENINLFGAGVGEAIPQDAVQEFRVITNNFDAQYGRASGGVVNVSTKSGTNSLHGSAWEYNRLAAYTSNTFANAVTGAPKGQYTRNQFGYDVGGPIKKDKLFFFQSTEWLRVRSNAVLQSYVPTPQFLALTAPNVQGYFAKNGAQTFNFASTLTQADVQTIVGPSSAGSSSPFAGIPAATPVLGLVNFTAPSNAGGGTPQNTYRIIGRLDFNVTNSTQLFFRYALENLLDFNGSDYASVYSLYNVGDTSYNNAALLSLSHTYTPTLFSNTKASFSRLKFKNTVAPTALSVPELLMNGGPVTLNGIPVQLPGTFAQFAGTGGLPFGGPQNVLQLTHDMSWTKGKHNIRFGGLYDYQQINYAFGAYAQGIEQLATDAPTAFDNLVSGSLALFQVAINPQGELPCRRNPLTGKLMTSPACTLTLPATQPSFARSYRYQDGAVYAEDSWRVTPRFTFNYGLRWEHFGVQHNNKQNLDSNFYYGPGSSYYQQVANGQVELTQNSPVHGFWKPRWGTLGPRVGFAYDLFGDGKTSIRGGYGISYERNFGNVTFNAIQNPPAYASLPIFAGEAGVAPPVVTADNLGPFAAAGTLPFPPASLRHMDQNIETAQTQFVSLAVERQVAKNSVFSIEYAGAHGIHLYDIFASNPNGGAQAFLGLPFTGRFTRPNTQYTGINTRDSAGSSHYSALNIRFQTQNLHNTGLNLTANYTWAHSTDDLSSTFSDSTQGASAGIGNLGYLYPPNPRLDWGSSDFDIRHRVVISPIWSIPWLKSGHGWKQETLGGWTLVGIFTARTGTPFSVFDTTNSLNASAGYGIPRYVPTTPFTQRQTGTPVQEAPNVNSFNVMTLPVANETPFNSLLGISDFGPFPATMTGRNLFRGPGAWNFDAAVHKTFSLTERFKLEFTAEGFDVFNHHNFYVNQLLLDAANFAPGGVPGPIKVTALKGGLGLNNVLGVNNDERRFGQFALRLMF